MIRYFLISNMYPDEESPGYGVFVKNTEENLSREGLVASGKALIVGRSKSIYGKITKYLKFYLRILTGFFGKYDFIYIHFPNQAILFLYPLSFIRKKPIIVNYHGEDLIYPDSGLWHWLGIWTEAFCRNRATAIVVPSTYFKEIIIKRHIKDEKQIIVSPSGGLNESVFYPEARNSTDFVVGYVGRLEPDKGILDYLCSFKEARKVFPIKGIIIGYGSCYDEVKTFILENNFSGSIQLINGVSQSQLREYYNKMDLFLFSSSRTGESLGLTGLEAMSCAVPVIGSNKGGISTYVIDGYNGFLITPGNISEIVKKVLRYHGLPEGDKQRMKDNARQTASLYFSKVVGQKLAAQFRDILNPIQHGQARY